MRQLILVNKDDVKGLMAGNNWEISASGSVTIGYDGKLKRAIGRPRGSYKKDKDNGKTEWQQRKERRALLPTPYKCAYCPRKFISAPGMGSHIHSAHPGKQFKNNHKGRKS